MKQANPKQENKQTKSTYGFASIQVLKCSYMRANKASNPKTRDWPNKINRWV